MATPADAHYTPLGVRLTRWIPHYPHPPQEAFLWLDQREAMYGGAAGGGKSDALLMTALQYVDIPGYSALILRRTYPDLALPGAIMDRSKEWLHGTDAHWNDNDRRWTFPSGATLTFGYLQVEKDKYRYQGAEFHFIAFDELTQFEETQYRYLLSRLRRLEGSTLPIRMRAASNPGGIGHEWVKQRFITEGATEGRPFMPAKLSDNPSLDTVEYRSALQDLDHHTRAQLLDGDWDSRPPGDLFRREWFDIVQEVPAGAKRVRFWDLAATEASETNRDPDYTAGCLLSKHPNGTWYVEDIQRFRAMPGGVKSRIVQTAASDGTGTRIELEQEPGSSGKTVVDSYVRDYLAQYAVRGRKSTGKKFARAQPVSSKAEHGLVKLVAGPWISEFLDELEAFSEDDKAYAHDDQVDALSGAFEALGKDTTVRSFNAAPGASGEQVTVRGDLILKGDKYVDKT
jgi:phage uncharacterized protein (putative large terminase), C-terminal domain